MTDIPIQRFRLNGVTPPVGTLLPGIEPMVVDSVDETGCNLQRATQQDFMDAGMRKPDEVHSVYEHRLIRRRMTPFGLARVMGD